MNIKQREDETLRFYITRFNKEELLIDEINDKILIVAFTNGLRNENFLFSLYKNYPKTITDVLYRVIKYVNAEDTLLAWEEKPKEKERQEEAWQDRDGNNQDWRSMVNPLLGGSQVSPRLMPQLIKSWCR